MMAKQQPYTDDFFLRQQSGSYRSACVVIPLVRALLPVRSVCDVGCGVGTWLRCWREHGVEDVLGIDGDYVARAQLMVPQENFRPADLRQPIRCDRRFDLAMSMEVAEHLPGDRAAAFVADLAALAPVVLFSAAVPGQGGTDHVNEQWQTYWAALFEQAGFATFDVLRPRMWDNETVEFWYRQNTLLFCHHEAVSRYPALTEATPRMPLSVVHPAQFRHAQSFGMRQSIGALRRSLRSAIAGRTRRVRPGRGTSGG